MRMRFRTDGWHYADLKAHGWVFGEPGQEGEKIYGTHYSGDEWLQAKKCWDETPAAQLGDVWRVHWSRGVGYEGPDKLAGYAICCVGCGYVHAWTHAGNCNAPKRQYTWTDQDGNDHIGEVCIHSGETSCWEWSGSAEEGTLTARPSLQVTSDECKWHGYITNGEIHN